MSEHPIYDELEAKWAEEYYRRAICDTYLPVIHVQTGQTWLEDDEGNEVFPDVPTHAYIVPNEVKVGDTVTPVSLGGVIPYPELDKPSPTLPKGIKPKFKLFGRNQGTNGTL